MIRILCLASLVALIGIVQAGDKHHNGHQVIKVKKSGKHQIYRGKNHTAHAHLSKGKVTGLSVKHNRTGKAKPVKKFKTNQKRHALAATRAKDQLVMASPKRKDAAGLVAGRDKDLLGKTAPGDAVHRFVGDEAVAQGGVIWVGFGFYNGQQWIIFWFPINMVAGGTDGATDYDGNG
jgi:hypothetical protein